jgi:hypothetical protein
MEHCFQRCALMSEQRMPGWEDGHQWIGPHRLGDHILPDVGGACESDIIEICLQSLDLLAVGNLEETYLDLRFLRSTASQQFSQSGRGKGVRDRDP